MAFKSSKAAVLVSPSNAGNNWEKATAFINVFIATPTGKRKVGSIALRESKTFEAALIKRLSADDEAIGKMKDVLELDFQLVNNDPIPTESLGF